MNNLTKNIINGSAWMLFQTVSLKLLSFISQITLAWILLPEIFGKVAIMTALTNITFITQQFGLQDVLIKRGKSFHLWFKISKSLTIIVSIIALIISAIVAFLANIIYQDIEITYIILLISLSIPFQALSILPDTKLKIDLRFDLISKLKIIEFFGIQAGIVVFALLGYGIYSFVFPVIIISLVRCFWLYQKTKLSLDITLYLNHWKYLLMDSLYGFYFALTSRISFQLDYLIIGLFVSKTEVGVYFMAFTLAVQAVGLLVVNLPMVIFPTLNKSKITDSDLGQKMISIIRILSIFGALLCSWQYFSAVYLVKFFLDKKWYDTIPLFQILSLGMFFRIMSSQWVVPLKLKGKFKKLAIISTYSLSVMLLILLPLAYFFGILGVAYGISFYYFIIAIFQLYKSFQFFSINLIHLFINNILLLLLGIISFYASFLIADQVHLTSNVRVTLLLKLVIISIFGASIFFLLLRVIFRKDFYFLKSKINSILK